MKHHTNYDMDKVFTELDMHCRVNGRYGFTIPYLINTSSNKQENLDINEFLLALAHGSKQYIITLCDDLNEIILGLHKPKEHAPLHMYPCFENLYYDEDKVGFFVNLEELSNHLTNKYSATIKQGKFSKNIHTLNWEKCRVSKDFKRFCEEVSVKA